MSNTDIKKTIDNATRIVVAQAENPDGDSLGSALALEEILGDMDKRTDLFCPVDIPKYLRYASGWDRVTNEYNVKSDLVVIVDTSAKTLLEKALSPEVLAHLAKVPVLVIDHHDTDSDLPFRHELICDSSAVSTAQVIYDIATKHDWKINKQAAEHLLMATLSDSLGLTSEATTSKCIRMVADLVDKGASISDLENRRRQFMKKSPDVLAYKGALLQRIEYHLDGQLALVHVPWEEIEKYSDKYNPGALVIDDMRLVQDVKVAVVIKTYPDGKLTGKIRANPEAKVAETVAGFFGGGGHVYAAGFRVYESYEKILPELIQATHQALTHYKKS